MGGWVGRWAGVVIVATVVSVSWGEVVKQPLGAEGDGVNLLRSDGWKGYEAGFTLEGGVFFCDNGAEAGGRRGAGQTVVLNQAAPAPIVAEAWSRAEGVGGVRDSDYALYLDLIYADGTPLWGQVAAFSVGTHDWERRRVAVLPAKPVKSVSFYLLLRGHAGKAWFKDARLQVISAGAGSAVFDGTPVNVVRKGMGGFSVRDVAAGSEFWELRPGEKGGGLGLELSSRRTQQDGMTRFEATLRDVTGRDRAVTLYYSVPAGEGDWHWLANPRRAVKAVPPGEYLEATRFEAGANGMLSLYPFAAIAAGKKGLLMGIDAGWPAFYRCGYSAGAGELYVAFDLGLIKEKPQADVRFIVAEFDGTLGFRGALQRYYEQFPEYFRCRTPEQGVWMPFAPISKVEGWEDFGFKFKEGADETAWDDAHGIVTFWYTEPMTWWMAMPKEMPRTLEAALKEARRMADAGNVAARAFLTSGFHDERGQYVARLLDTPWCNGAVWSINSSPGIAGEITDWSQKFGPAAREQRYGPQSKGTLDGEYIDSSEGYVTDELDFRREHLAAARRPLTFATDSCRPAVFRGLIAGEYARAMAETMHAQGKLMMANATPSRICWLAPWLDVMGTETNWHVPVGAAGERKYMWQPMSDAEMLYRRALCGPKPFCFLMNTDFPVWGADLTEQYMKRCLAYGMFPGFFSSDASTGHYFSQPALYNRDRALFKKYVPLCKRVAEAGWQPSTRARADEAGVYVERFGERLLTVFRKGEGARRAVTVVLDGLAARGARELVSGRSVAVEGGKISLELGAEDVAVVELEEVESLPHP